MNLKTIEGMVCECCKKSDAKVYDYRKLPENLVDTEHDKNIVKNSRFKFRTFVTCFVCWKFEDARFWLKVTKVEKNLEGTSDV